MPLCGYGLIIWPTERFSLWWQNSLITLTLVGLLLPPSLSDSHKQQKQPTVKNATRKSRDSATKSNGIRTEIDTVRICRFHRRGEILAIQEIQHRCLIVCILLAAFPHILLSIPCFMLCNQPFSNIADSGIDTHKAKTQLMKGLKQGDGS